MSQNGLRKKVQKNFETNFSRKSRFLKCKANKARKLLQSSRNFSKFSVTHQKKNFLEISKQENENCSKPCEKNQ